MEPTAQNLRPETQLLYYWNILVKRRYLIVAFALVLTVTVGVTSMLSTRIYRAQTAIEISPSAPVVLANDQPVSQMVPEVWVLEQYYATQYVLIRSAPVLAGAVDKLRSEHGVTEFDGIEHPEYALAGAVTVNPKSGTNIVYIAVEHSDPKRAALFADVVAEAYVDYNLKRALDVGEDAFKWLSEQRRVYQATALDSAKRLHEARIKAGLGAEQGVDATIEAQASLQEAWGQAHTRRVIAESRYDELRNIRDGGDWLGLASNLALGDDVLRALLADEQDLQQERTGLAAKYKAEHPEMQRVDREVKGVEAQIRVALATAIAAQKTTLDLAKAEEERLTTELDAVTRVLTTRGEDVITLELVKTQSERDSETFNELARRQTEVGLSQFMRANNVHMISNAVVPTVPVRPQVMVNVLSAILVGILGGCAFALALEYVDATVQSREEVEAATDAPMLGIVPILTQAQLDSAGPNINRSIVAYAMPKSNVAECLRTVRTNILFQASKRPIKRMLITSSQPREGKSFITSNLAAIIAMAGTRVLAIDGDFRRPTLHKRFQLSNDYGLSNVLTGQMSLADAIQPSHVPGLHILVTGPSPANPSEVLGLDRMRTFLDGITGYDLIIIDSPPVNVVSDALVMATLTDGVVFVVEANRTNRRLVTQCAQRLREANTNLLGTVVNKLDVRHAGYGYYYYYYDYAYYMEGNEDSRQGQKPPAA
jgi:polysaccharide biosynthesis transport protein